MKARKVIGGLIAVFMAAVLFGGMVYAEPPAEAPVTELDAEDLARQVFTSDDVDAAFDSLTAPEQQAVIHFINGTETTSSDVMIGMATGASSDYDCRIHRYTAVKRSLGLKLASYISSTDFCYDGDYIVGQPYVYATGRVHFYGWVFLGNISVGGGLGPDNEWHKDRAEGSFRACRQWFCQGWRPVIHKKQYGSGDGWGWED